MKTANVLVRSIALGLGLLTTAFADYAYVSVNYYSSPPWKSGIVYGVPAGANYEWYVNGAAQILLGGGGLNVNQSGSYGADVGTTAYAGDISYNLSAYGPSGEAYFYVGW